MRVLMLSSLWPPTVLGGAELYAAALAEHLRDRGHDVGVVTLGVPGSGVVATLPVWPYPPGESPVQPAAKRALFHFRDLFDPSTPRRLRTALSAFRPDVVHSHAVQGMSSLALSVPAGAGVAHVHTLHDYWLLCQRDSMVQRDGTVCGPRRCVSCLAVSTVRAGLTRRHPPHEFIAVSEAVAREHRELSWVRDHLRVIYNPVEVAETNEVHPRGPERAGVTFGYLGRLTTTKGVGLLLEAFAAAGIADGRLVVAGDGPLADTVRAAGRSVEALGWVDDHAKREFLATIDALVVPSCWNDPAPLVVNEATARRIPVIGAQAGGIPELVPPGSEPLLFPRGDADALAHRLRTFAADPPHFQPRSLPTSALGWDAHLDRVVAAYDAAVGAATCGAGS